MGRPYGLLRAGFPYLKCLSMRRTTNFPIDIAIGKAGRLYILCRNDGTAMIRKYTVEDEDLGTIGRYGHGEGQFTWPVTIIADPAENLYVSDEFLHRIVAFSSDGEHLGTWGEPGTEPGHLNGPAGIAFNPDGHLYVVDSLNHRVQKFTKGGEFLLGWGHSGEGPGEFNMPWGIAVDELGDVYVSDWRNDRVQKFNAEGEFLFAFGASGSEKGEFNRPAGIAVDAHGDIYVADPGNNRIQLFNAEGRYVQRFLGDATLSKVSQAYMMTNGSPNRMRDMADLEPQKYLRQPKSVAISAEGLMFVPDYGSYRVQVYQKQAVPLTQQQLSPPRRSVTLHQE